MPGTAAEFEAACWQAIAEAQSRGYNPTYWISMINRHGAVAAAKLLLEKDELQDGFLKLISMRRPNLTVEWAVLDAHWSHLFHQKHLDAARRRLDQAGVRNHPGASD